MSNHRTEILQLAQLDGYANHPFKLYDGKKLAAMTNSIRENGVLVPIIVRPKEDGKFEILSGHNRVAAAKNAGKTEIPAVVREDLTDEEVRIIVTVTNLHQRSFSDLAHSERAAALSAHYEAVKSQGKRTDLLRSFETLLDDTLLPEGVDDGTYDHGGHKLKAREEVAKCYGLSGTVVERYVRMSRLIKPLLDRLDNGEFPLLAAVEASVLKTKEQEMLDELLKDGKYRLTTAKAKLFRSPWRDEETGLISRSKMEEYLTDSPQAPVSVSVKVKQDVLTRYFGEDESADDISDTIAKALDMWFAARKAEAESST